MFPATIFALSTPFGRSGLCIFRLSGTKAFEVIFVAILFTNFNFQIARLICSKDLRIAPRKMQLVTIKSGNKIIDSGLACGFMGKLLDLICY